MLVSVDGDTAVAFNQISVSNLSGNYYITATRSSTNEKINLTITCYSGSKAYLIQNTGIGINSNESYASYTGTITGFVAENGEIVVTKQISNYIYGTFYFYTSPSGSVSGSFVVPQP